MEIKKVGIIGGGLMGRQIGLNTAIYDYEVHLFDMKPEVRDAVREWEETYLAGRIAKGRMSEEKVAGIKARFHVVDAFEEAVSGMDLIIEAVPEIEAIKHSVMKQISDAARPDAIIATNSSYMVSSIFFPDVTNPERLCNAHYYNPALVMKFVEVVCNEKTSDDTRDTMKAFCERTGKTPAVMPKEIDGFIANRIIRQIYRESKWLVQNGYCTWKDIDVACENGLGHPMGPFRLNDLTGIDLSFDMMKATYEKTGQKPDMYDVYEEMVKQGKLGRKTGHGFYDYE